MSIKQKSFDASVAECLAAGEVFLKQERPRKLTITLFRYEPNELEVVVRTGPASGSLLEAMGAIEGKTTSVVNVAVKMLFAESKAANLGYQVISTPARRKGMSVRDVSLVRVGAGD